MGCHSTTNKHKLKNKEDSSNKKEINSKHTLTSIASNSEKYSNGNFEKFHIFSKIRNLDNNNNDLLVEKKPEFERISPFTIIDGILSNK